VKANWTPAHGDGGTYCSPACGGGCTLKEYDRACQAAQALCKRLGRGWEPVVYENLGWHWHVRRGMITMYQHESPRRWRASLDTDTRQITAKGTTPRATLLALQSAANDYFLEVARMLEETLRAVRAFEEER
jgi:hypothetical protein